MKVLNDTSAKRSLTDVVAGENVIIYDFVNAYRCTIGNNTKIGAFVEIQQGVVIGKNCKISSHSFICEGVAIEDDVFIGHGVLFINDKYPRSTNEDGSMKGASDWSLVPTTVRRGASIGTGTVILCGVTIGENAIVGAGSVVTRDVLPNSTVMGNPAITPPPPIRRSRGRRNYAGFRRKINDAQFYHGNIFVFNSAAHDFRRMRGA
jgi:acetyltransferase-like isoleucine patch superfamily enzyme